MRKIAIAVVAGLSAAAALTAYADGVPKGSAADAAEVQARAAWREAIIHVPAPEADACFHASYPATEWKKVECTKAPNILYLPRSSTLARGGGGKTGDGNDYVAEAPGLMSAAVGSFPTVTGVTSEKDGRSSNVYSLQLNSNFMTTAVCNGTKGCLSWEQFVYSSSEKSAFMQYWLIDYGATCPSGWNTTGKDCYKNSAAVSVPQEAITQLANLSISATAVENGTDTLVFTTATEAYSTTGKDTVVDLATGWEESEFNIVGDGGGSEATFNTGASVTVKIAITDGSTSAPNCVADAGTTGETNNLTLKSCSASSGSKPSVQFVESD